MVTITANAPTTATSVKALFIAANATFEDDIGGKQHILISTATNTSGAIIVVGGLDHTGAAAINASASPIQGHQLIGDGTRPMLFGISCNPDRLLIHANTTGQPLTISVHSVK